MQLLSYTEAHHRFRKRLREFLSTEVSPCVDQWEKDRIVPKSVWRRMGQEGFLCPTVSADYGAIGGDFLYSVIVSEELARTNHSGLFAQLHSDVVVPYIDAFASREQKAKYLPGCVSGELITAVAMTEPDAGSDLAGINTTAEEDGEEVVINGSKTFISNGINADLVIVAAKDPAVENPYEALSLYIVEDKTPGFKRGRHLDKMGMWSQDTAELFFTGCRIPKANLLGTKGQGFSMLMQKLQQERLVTSVCAQAAAEMMLEWTTNYCRQHTDAAGKPIAREQAAQFALVEMATDVKLGRTFLDKLIVEHMAGENVVVETSMAKYWITDLAKRVSQQCLDLHAEFGLTEACPVARAFRDTRVMPIFAGTNEIMKQIAGKFMGL